MVKSVSYDQGEIIKNIISLYIPSGKIDCDPTYSKGNFYNKTGITPPTYKFEINSDSYAYDKKNVIIPEIPKKLMPTNSIYKKFLKCLLDKSKKIKVIKATQGQKLSLRKGEIQILGPIKNNYDNLNDFSVVCKYVYGNCAFLFGGDAQKAAEHDLIQSKQNLKADVLKLNHHGSKTSNTVKFLKAVGAKIYVVEVGKNNSYGHPHKNVLKTLKMK